MEIFGRRPEQDNRISTVATVERVVGCGRMLSNFEREHETNSVGSEWEPLSFYKRFIRRILYIAKFISAHKIKQPTTKQPKRPNNKKTSYQ